jgi:RimJ/RimL family protein N-acetyltransferase
MTEDFVEIRGERVVLRDPRPEDLEAHVRWHTVETAWQDWDAPWDIQRNQVPPERMEESLKELRRRLLEKLTAPLSTPRPGFWIERIGGPLLGHVGQYHHDAKHRSTMIGIAIYESAYWDQGLGTEALGLWVDYLFASLDLHRIGLDTWSGNVRMMRCAEKCGFLLEGRLRETVEWRGQRYDSVKFGMLRREWEARWRR